MTPLRRYSTNKGASARTFRKRFSKTKAANLGPQRGGWRL